LFGSLTEYEIFKLLEEYEIEIILWAELIIPVNNKLI
jgi:hypothetical protein